MAAIDSKNIITTAQDSDIPRGTAGSFAPDITALLESLSSDLGTAPKPKSGSVLTGIIADYVPPIRPPRLSRFLNAQQLLNALPEGARLFKSEKISKQGNAYLSADLSLPILTDAWLNLNYIKMELTADGTWYLSAASLRSAVEYVINRVKTDAASMDPKVVKARLVILLRVTALLKALNL